MPSPIVFLKSKFLYLLIALNIYFVSIALVDTTSQSFLLSSIFTFIILLCMVIIAHRKQLLLIAIVTGSSCVFLHWSAINSVSDHTILTAYYGLNLFYLILVTYTIFHSVTQHMQITVDSLSGAVCGYFLIGLMWSLVFSLIALHHPDSFSAAMFSKSIHTTSQNFYYYSFTTLTTLGYGDIAPVSDLARTCSWLEAISGQIYLAVWISQLVGLRISQHGHIQS